MGTVTTDEPRPRAPTWADEPAPTASDMARDRFAVLAHVVRSLAATEGSPEQLLAGCTDPDAFREFLADARTAIDRLNAIINDWRRGGIAPAPGRVVPDQFAFTDFRGLVRALRRARTAKGISCEELDHLAQLTDRYVNKLENYRSPTGRMLADASLAKILRALGYTLLMVPDGSIPRPQEKRRKQ